MVQLIELFEKYIRWRILTQFLTHPNTSFYIKELARTLNVSPGSVSTAVKFFGDWELLIREEKERVHLYRLNQEHPLAHPLKKTYGLVLVLSSRPAEKFLKVDGNIISIALFGSYTDGSYDEKSDIDILIISPSKKEMLEAIRSLEDELGKNVNVSLFKLSDWRLLARGEDAFYKKVVQSHILLFGSGLT